MKKLSIIAGLGLLATTGTAFAAWSFNYTPTTLQKTDLDVAISVDTQFSDIGAHGNLTLNEPGFNAVQIEQNDAKNSAKFNYTGNLNYVLTYTPANDGNPDPDEYSFTVNAVVTTTLTGNSTGITVNSDPIVLSIDQDHLTASVSISSLLAKISFPSITTEAAAETFINNVKGLASKQITFTFTLQ